jgi:E3 ubiquitin-protein ligase HERC2
VYPIVTYAGPHELGSDRAILSQPSVELVMCLLDARLMPSSDRSLITRLATALASCAQLSSLGESKTTCEKLVKIPMFWNVCSLLSQNSVSAGGMNRDEIEALGPLNCLGDLLMCN